MSMEMCPMTCKFRRRNVPVLFPTTRAKPPHRPVQLHYQPFYLFASAPKMSDVYKIPKQFLKGILNDNTI